MNAPITTNPATVWIVDDDEAMRQSLAYVLRVSGHEIQQFECASDFLSAYQPSLPGCLIFDLAMPSMSGLTLLEKTRAIGGAQPVIMITGFGEVKSAVRAMHLGAIDFIEKPFHYQEFLKTVQAAIDKDQQRRARDEKVAEIQRDVESLTTREREVLAMVLEGLSSKEMADRLAISPKTVEVHRSHVTRKMHCASIARLVRLLTEYPDAALQHPPSV